MAQPAVVFHNVTFAYLANAVLSDVSFSIDAGETIALIGPNGGGKTTLLKCILGFLQPQQGAVEVLGHSPRVSRRHIAYVPQALQFDSDFPISVWELVLAGRMSQMSWYGRYASADRRAAQRALRRVGLSDFKDHQFGTLSGGQRQRALIARALTSEPQILLLDEPTANVDSQAEADIYALLQELKGSMTILMVTHDLPTVINKVDRVLCVQREVLSLKPEEVCEHFVVGLYHPPLVRKDNGKKGGRR